MLTNDPQLNANESGETNREAETATTDGAGQNGGGEVSAQQLAHRLSSFQYDCLVAIRSEGEPKGRRIQELIGEQRGEPVNHGTLYDNLNLLAEKEVLEKRPKNGRANGYCLTEFGMAILDVREQWFAEGISR